MSKIAWIPIEIPDNIKMILNGNVVDVEGPDGKLSFEKIENMETLKKYAAISTAAICKFSGKFIATAKKVGININITNMYG